MSELISETKVVMVNSLEVEIPEGWAVEKIGDVAEKTKGSKPDTIYEEPDQDRLPYLTISASKGEVSQWAQADDGKRVSSEDILIVWDGASSGTVFKSTDGVIGSTLASLTFDDSVDSDYAYYFLSHSEDRISTLGEGTGISHVPRDFMEIFEVLKPPLPEQRRIADILSTIDEQIQQTDGTVTKTQELKHGVLNELIPRGIDEQNKIRSSPEKDPEAYEEVRRCNIPSKWSVSSLQDICDEDVTYGIVQAGPHVEDGVPYIKTGDMTNGELNVEDLSRTSEEIAEDYSRSEIQTGELVITIRATVGDVKQVPPELDGANLTQGTARISPDDSINNRYLLWAIRSNLVQSLIDARTKGSTFNEITLGTLRKVPIPHPKNLDEQMRIAEKIDSIENKLQAEKLYLNELKELKRGLMQDLLTGKVRVDPD